MSPAKKDRLKYTEYSSSSAEMNEGDEIEEYENTLILNKSFSSIGNTNKNKSEHDIRANNLKQEIGN